MYEVTLYVINRKIFNGILKTTLFNKKDKNNTVLFLRYVDDTFSTF